MINVLNTIRAEFVLGVQKLEAELKQLLATVEQKKADLIATHGGIQAVDQSLARHAANEKAEAEKVAAAAAPAADQEPAKTELAPAV